MEAALFGLITGDAGFAAIAGTRLYPIELPQPPVYPAATYTIVSDDPDYSHDGATGACLARVQIDFWGGDLTAGGFGKARVLFDAVAALMSGKVIDHAGHRFEAVQIENVATRTEGGQGNSLRIARRRCDLTFWHKEL